MSLYPVRCGTHIAHGLIIETLFVRRSSRWHYIACSCYKVHGCTKTHSMDFNNAHSQSQFTVLEANLSCISASNPKCCRILYFVCAALMQASSLVTLCACSDLQHHRSSSSGIQHCMNLQVNPYFLLLASFCILAFLVVLSPFLLFFTSSMMASSLNDVQLGTAVVIK